MSTPLRLGIIGLSEGNGHPYSWSAIFNGYEPEAMETCGFASIPRYLEREKWPDAAIPDARVTHVWTQDRALSKHIAEASRIPHVVERFTDMIGEIDGLLLARDDAECHYQFAVPYLDAGIPVYVDKPLALSVSEAQRLFARERFAGQLFTCSALRYARELSLSAQARMEIGHIRYIHAMAPKDWDRYAVHVVEPMLALIDGGGEMLHTQVWREDGITALSLAWASGIQATVTTLGARACPFALRVCGRDAWRELVFSDSFSAFKSALQDFVSGIRERGVRIRRESVLEIVRIIEDGRKT
jgi:hypothetical protein